MYPAVERLNLKSLLEHAHVAVVIHRMDTSIAYANPTALRLLDLTYNTIIGKDAYDPGWFFIDEFDHRLKVEEYPVNVALKTREPLINQVIGRFQPATEEVVWYLVNAYIEPDVETDDPDGGFVVVTFNDISAQRHLFSYRDIIENTHDAVIVTEAEDISEPFGPKIVFVNKAFENLTGFTAAEAMGETPRILQGRGTDPETISRIRSALEERRPIRETVLNYSKQGEPYWLDMSIFPLKNRLEKVTHFAAIERDVTQATYQSDQLAKRNDDLRLLKNKLESLVAAKTKELRQLNYQLEKRAYFDDLTGLPNRRSFMDQAARQFHFARRYKHHLAVGIIDIDHFKKVNDTFGHEAGDRALALVAERIRSHSRGEDVCGRLGGEEFAFVTIVADPTAANRFFERVKDAVADEPVRFDGVDIPLTISVGICVVAPESVIEVSDGLRLADKAMYKAKKAGRNQVVASH